MDDLLSHIFGGGGGGGGFFGKFFEGVTFALLL